MIGTEILDNIYRGGNTVIEYTPDPIDEYTVIVLDPKDWQEVHDYIINENEIDGIPNRKVECVDDRNYCIKTSVYMMSVEEANLLRTHPKVEEVELNQDKYPQPVSFDELVFETKGSDPQRWNKNVAYHKPRWRDIIGTTYAPTTHTNGVRSNWSHKFINTTDSTPFRGSGISDIETSNSDMPFYLTGRNVDAISMDRGVAVLHPEFIAPDGTYRVRDIILDGPYKVDPEFFDADPTNRLETVTIDGVNIGTRAKESVARAWWGNTGTSYRSSKFSGLGTKSISSNYTRVQAHSKNGTNSITHGHGTAVASQIGGKSFGLAIDCNIWNARTDAVVGNSLIIGSSTYIDVVTIWHNAKKIASDDPDPTILNMSFGGFNYAVNSNGTTYQNYYRGSWVNWTGNGSNSNAPANSGPSRPNYELVVKRTSSYFSRPSGKGMFPVTDSTASSAVESAISNGVICVTSAGNMNQKLSTSNDMDFNNWYIGPTGQYPNNNYSWATNRAGGVTKGFSGDHERLKGTIRVGALDNAVEPTCEKQGVSAYKIRKADYSSNGPMITIWAPAQSTLAAGYANYESYAREDDSNYYDGWFGGTSSACPNTVSLICLYLQTNRSASQSDAVNWLDTTASKAIAMSDPYPSEGSTSSDDLTNYYWGATSSSTSHDYPTNVGDSYNRRGCGNLRGATNKVLYNPFVNGTATDRPEVDVIKASGISISQS